jgi:hypothetical protein
MKGEFYEESSRVIVVAYSWGGGVLFAQEFKWNGYVNSGLGLVSTDQKIDDPAGGSKSKAVTPYLTAFGVDSWQYGYRLRLDGSFINKDENAGIKVRFQSQGTSNQFFAIPYAYGWVKFLNQIFTVSGGLVDDGTWNSGGAILGANDPDQGEGLGALVKISPLAGLDIGLGVYAIQNQGGDVNNRLGKELAKNKVDWDKAKYTFNVGYTVPDIVKIVGTARLENWTRDEQSSPGKPALQTSRAIVAAKLLSVKGLNAILEAEFVNLDAFGDEGKLNIYETLGYKIDDLGFGLNAVQFTSNVEAEKTAGLEFNPWVNYAIGNIIPQLDLVYFYGGQSTLAAAATGTNANTKYNRFTSYTSKYDGDYSVFSVRPSVKFAFGSSAFIEVGDLINFEKGPEGTYGHPEDKKKDSRITNVVYVDFKWSF